MDLVSIIIPAYNCENYIKRCLESIVNQTYKNTEIIVVNDGSTDNTLSTIKDSFNDERIVIINKKNEGVSKARNDGIQAANGKYVMFIDSDDWLEIDAIEKLHDIITKEKVDVVRSNYYINKSEHQISGEGKLYELEDKTFKGDEIESKVIDHFLLFKNSIQNLVMLLFINREFLNKIPKFNTGLYMMEDAAFYMNMFCNIESIHFTSYKSYHYYYNENSVTKSKNKYLKTMLGVIDANKEIRQILNTYSINKKERIEKLNGNHLKIIMSYVFYAYRDKMENKAELVEALFESEKIKDIYKRCNINELSIKNKILITLLKLRLKTLMKIVLYLFSCIKKEN